MHGFMLTGEFEFLFIITLELFYIYVLYHVVKSYLM